MNLAIIADDFTGANDIGIQLKKYGLKVSSIIESCETNADVEIVDTNSRNKEEKEAIKNVKKAYINLEKNGFDKFYKKIDSTLRGNIKAEIDEIIRLSGKTISLVVAFPKTGRCIKNGKHYLNDIELDKTDFANDPIKPIKTNDLKKIFPNGILIKISDIKENKMKFNKESKDVLIFDSETDEELEMVAKYLYENDLDDYIAGSAGIMEYMPKYWGLKQNKVLMISGSCNNENIEQMENFIKEKKESLKIIKLDLKKFTYKIEGNGNDFLIKNIEKKPEMQEVLRYHLSKGLKLEEINEKIGNYISELSYEIIRKHNINSLFIAGGETSIKVLKKLKIKAMNLEMEIETGVIKGIDLDKVYHIITKPGGFGSNKIYNRAYEILKTVDNKTTIKKNSGGESS